MFVSSKSLNSEETKEKKSFPHVYMISDYQKKLCPVDYLKNEARCLGLTLNEYTL